MASGSDVQYAGGTSRLNWKAWKSQPELNQHATDNERRSSEPEWGSRNFDTANRADAPLEASHNSFNMKSRLMATINAYPLAVDAPAVCDENPTGSSKETGQRPMYYPGISSKTNCLVKPATENSAAAPFNEWFAPASVVAPFLAEFSDGDGANFSDSTGVPGETEINDERCPVSATGSSDESVKGLAYYAGLPINQMPQVCKVDQTAELLRRVEGLKQQLREERARTIRASTENLQFRAALKETADFINIEPERLRHAVEMILRLGWKEITWRRGYTVLHLAAECGNGQIMPLLVKLGANPKSQDSKGRTAADVAKVRGYSHCVEILRELQV